MIDGTHNFLRDTYNKEVNTRTTLLSSGFSNTISKDKEILEVIYSDLKENVKIITEEVKNINEDHYHLHSWLIRKLEPVTSLLDELEETVQNGKIDKINIGSIGGKVSFVAASTIGLGKIVNAYHGKGINIKEVVPTQYKIERTIAPNDITRADEAMFMLQYGY